MAEIFKSEIVKYACTCGLLKPIPELYFCRHCLQLRCGFCVCHEVDSYYCGKCAENIPTSEARMKKNRCTTCLECPSCQHHLSTRIASSGPKNADDKNTPKKKYYLICLFCQWNSRDADIPDQTVAFGSWKDRENEHTPRLSTLQDMFKNLMLHEKQMKLDSYRKKHLHKGKYITLTDKTGLTAAMARKRLNLPEPSQQQGKLDKGPLPAVAEEDVEGLPEDVFTKPLELAKITTLKQRLLQPHFQPTTVDQMFPIHKRLLIKRSQRCRSCEHNVSKPEINANTFRFKIQLFAYYHIPDVKLVTVSPMRAGQTSEVILKFCNPTQHPTTIQLLPLTLDESSEGAINRKKFEPLEIRNEKSEVFSPSSLQHVPLTKPSLVLKPREISARFTCQCSLPDSEVTLPQRDDAAEYDDSADMQNYQDDPKVVVWRRSNKAAIKFSIMPNADLKIGSEVLAGFIMKHTYLNTINKEPQKCDHYVKVFLKLGNVVGSA